MKSDRRRPVAIVGGGYSGTMVAAQLARRGIPSVLIERQDREGQGAAYSTPDPAHLLNVRAQAMSAWADRPDDFAQRVMAAGGDSGDFAQRRAYGAYLRDILAEAVAGGLVAVRHGRAVRADRDDDAWRIELAEGDAIDAGALVLATGNQAPGPNRLLAGAGPHLLPDPWSAEARAAVARLAAGGGAVLLVGTGLTAVDFILSLGAAGHRGPIVALSRRGQLPRAHAEFTPAPVEREALPTGDLLALWRWLRRRSGAVGWRAAVDSLRPHSHALWQSLSTDRQRRFLRHARPWWDVRRHRIAPQVADAVAAMIAAGQLEIVAGRIEAVEDAGDAASVRYRRRGTGQATTRRFDAVIDCTGPLGAIERTADPLLRQLLDDGMIAPDALGLGLAVDDRDRPVGSANLWAVGPLTKGRYWEMVAVPDIRRQVAAVADDIAREWQA